MMKRLFSLFFALYSYLMTALVLAYFVGFYTNWLVPKQISNPTETVIIDGRAVWWDFALLLLFGFQHSIMARDWFKRWWATIVPPTLERATYFLVSSLVLAFFIWQWQPLGGVIWDIRGSATAVFVSGLSILGLFIAAISVASLDALHFAGWRQLNAQRPTANHTPTLQKPLFYKLVRHPIYLGFMISFWATPWLTWGHLFFAVCMTAYIFIGATLEERNLVKHFGKAYEDYQREVAMLIPFVKFFK